MLNLLPDDDDVDDYEHSSESAKNIPRPSVIPFCPDGNSTSTKLDVVPASVVLQPILSGTSSDKAEISGTQMEE